MTFIDSLLSKITHDIGIDLGTSAIKVAVKGEGIVYNEPSVVAINNRTKKILAVGLEARQMIGRTPSGIKAIRPMKDGVISDFDSTEAMLRYFINKVNKEYTKSIKIPRPRVIVGIPSSVTEVECRAVIDAAKTAGSRKVYIIEEPMAAAIGSELPIEEPSGSMIIDIGGGTTDIVIVSLGGIVVDNTIKIAGDEMDQEIVNYARHKYNVLIGEKMAEDIKVAIGTAYSQRKEKNIAMRGRDLITGLPKNMEISSIEIREALQKVLDKIADAAKQALEKSPPELISDLSQKGVVLAGGGSLLPGISKYFQERLRLPVRVIDDPVNAVARGTETLLDSIDLLEKVQVTLDDLI
jgi:rod shape-determining protein MreB